MSPLVLLLIKRLAGNRGVEANPYFNDPGSAPYTDSTFDAYSQMPAKASNFWQRMSGDNFGDRINSQYLSTLAQQPILQNMAKFEKDMRLEEAKELAKLQQQMGREEETRKMSQLGKTAFDTFGDQYQYPFDFGGSDEDIGRRFSLAYGPQMQSQGIAGFSGAESTIAKNFADAVASENARRVGMAGQPYAAPIAENLAQRSLLDSAAKLRFAQGGDFERLMNINQSRELVPIHGAGFDDAFGNMYSSGHPIESTIMQEFGKNKQGEPVVFPKTIRSFEPGSVSPYGGIKLDRIDPSPPRSVETPPAPAELSVPSRNQDTTLGGNPLVPQTEEELMMLNIWRMRNGLPPINR